MILYLFFISNFGIIQTSDVHSHNINKSSIISNIEIPKDFNLRKIAKDFKEFGINNLNDDKHFEGLPLDRHGKVNPDFHKEIFLGNHELFESDIQHDKQKRNRKLEEIFNQVDADHNKYLSKEELFNYVLRNVQLHLKKAKDKNSQLFLLIDTNQNGKITWHEYAALYIKFHKMNSTTIKDLDDVNFIYNSLDPDLLQELLKIRYRWTASDGNMDNELNIDEFLQFRHPEIAGRSYKFIVDNLISQTDQDNDGKLDENEFVFLPANPMDNDGNGKQAWSEKEKRWIDQQKIEFHEIDENGDGTLTRDELLKAYDPMNRVHINHQIKKLFLKVDDSPKDNLLSLSELKNHADAFTDMHFLDIDKVLHKDI